MIKAVFLDVDNTLLDFNLSAKEAIKSAFSELGLTFSDNVMPNFLNVNDELWQRIEKKELTRQELHKIRWQIVFDKLQINAVGTEMEKRFLNKLFDCAILVDGALDLVKYLSTKYDVYTASNAPYPQQVNRLTISGIMPFVKSIMNFESQGIHKPQKSFFEKCLEAVSPIKSEEIALIGDSLTADMQGGKAVGFTTIWFNRQNKESPNGLCDYTVTKLSEIKRIL